MRCYEHSYRSGTSVVPRTIIEDIKEVIDIVKLPIARNRASQINKSIRIALRDKGWSDSIQIGVKSKISLTSQYKDIGLCVQTGNVSRTYADLLKLQTLFLKGTITCGIIIVPDNKAAKILGSNMANMQRLIRELDVFIQTITIPLVIIGFAE